MATFESIAPEQVDAKSPINELLMLGKTSTETGGIKYNFDALNDLVGGAGNVNFKLNGVLSILKDLIDTDPSNADYVDGAFVTKGAQFSRVRMFLKQNGTSGNTSIDVIRRTDRNSGILKAERQFSDTVQAIGRVGSALNTQAVSRRAATINTQSITRVKTQEAIESVAIVQAGVSARYNLAGGSTALDSDWQVGQKVKIGNMGNGANDGEFTILEVNPQGYPAIILDNAGAVQESGATGELDLQLFAYNYINPVDADGFVDGENVIFSSHTSAAMDGTFPIERINELGNNIVVYNDNAGADEQAGVAGTADGERWVYTFLASVTPTDYIVGDNLNASGHSSANNDGNLPIVAVNQGGDNLVVINPNGVVQAGVAGTINTNRWTYALAADPTGNIDIGQIVRFDSCTDPNNDGEFAVVEINRLALNNITVYNELGVLQLGAAGNALSARMIIGLVDDPTGVYEVDRSTITISGMVNANNNGEFIVRELNRQGGGLFDLTIDNYDGVDESIPVGIISLEVKSLFDSDLPVIPANGDLAVTGASAVFNPETVPADSIVYVKVLELPDGDPRDLTINLS